MRKTFLRGWMFTDVEIFFLLIFYIKSPLLHFFTLTTPSPRKDEEMWKLFQKFVSFLSSFPCAQSCDKSISSFSQRENGRKISFASHAPRFLFLLVCLQCSFICSLMFGHVQSCEVSAQKVWTQSYALKRLYWVLWTNSGEIEREKNGERNKFPRIFKLLHNTSFSKNGKILPLIPLIIQLYTHITNAYLFMVFSSPFDVSLRWTL